MSLRPLVASLALLLAAPFVATTASAQQAPAAAPAPAAAASAAAPQKWKYSTSRLTVGQVDYWLARPDKVLVLDVRRPDELIKYGSFPAYLNIQNQDLEKHLVYLPKDRVIITVSNHAQRAGAAGDLLTAKGFKVAGATGSEDYEQEGGKQVTHIQPPAPRNAAATATPVAAAAN